MVGVEMISVEVTAKSGEASWTGVCVTDTDPVLHALRKKRSRRLVLRKILVVCFRVEMDRCSFVEFIGYPFIGR
jgi:hypothetical protein